MSRRILNLSSLPWQFGRIDRQPFSPQPVDDRPAVTEWLPARVPRDVRADLIAAGRIPPVETPEGIAAGAWVDDCDWWYRAELPAAFAPDDVAILEADGIDYFSAIWLDDRLVATHAGMFARQILELSPHLNRPGSHELAIRIWGGGALPRLPNPPWRQAMRWLVDKVSPGTEYFPDRMATPKAQFSFGWDFAPRLLSAGIWDDLRLVVTRGAYIEDLWVQAKPVDVRRGAARPGGEEAETLTPARFEVRLRVRRWQPGSMRAEIVVEPEGSSAVDSVSSGQMPMPSAAPQVMRRQPPSSMVNRPSSFSGQNLDLGLHLDLPSARLWWPWDQGEPHRYRVTARLVDDNGVLDEASQVIGVRSVARTELPGGGKWRWVINGRPVFLRGANWVPADVLPGRVSEADYVRLLNQARDAGINFLRVWGGGLREKRAFWEMCDRLGIVAWQEFPLACAFFDHYPRDPAYLSLLADEARGIVRALRNHPSLIAWSGGNEINPARERLPLGTLAGVLAEEDPSRPWIPASPCEGDVHQWQVWHGLAPWTSYAETGAPFMSEFGVQALPDAATLAEMFPADPVGKLPDQASGPTGAPRSLADLRWTGRKAQVAKLRRYAGSEADHDLAAAIAATQRAQAAALQAGIEACRLRREVSPQEGEADVAGKEVMQTGSKLCGGVAFWQFNEPWRAVSWSVIDRAGRPKAAYEAIRRCYQPILVAAAFPWRRYRAGDVFRAEIWLVNDGPEMWHGCRVAASLDGETIWSAGSLDLPPASATPIGEISSTLVTSPRMLSLDLSGEGGTLATNRYDLDVHLPGSQPWQARLAHKIADWLLETD